VADVDALIMAGGESKRMRRDGESRHKALVPVLGLPMIERNLRYLSEAGFDRITVAVSAREEELIAHLRRASCALLIERSPLGTIGAIREVAFGGELVVVNVDNLTALPLRALVEHHRSQGAQLTIAVHREPLPLDFGEVVVRDGRVEAYREKPVRYPLVSSGVYAVSPLAAACIARGERIGVPELFERLRKSGGVVSAFEHDGFWIDVNDLETRRRAEALLAE
jgi:NDP-sugar pyrophosphorylase family protein